MFLYIINKLSEREINKTIPFTIAPKKNEIPRNKFNQGSEDPQTENYKILMKETEEDMKNGKIFCAHGLEELIL